MIRRAALVLPVLWCAAAHANSETNLAESQTRRITPDGWTADGRFLAVGHQIYDGRTGKQVKVGAFAAWQQQHPLTPCVSGRRSPDQTTVAYVTLKGSRFIGDWSEGKFEYAEDYQNPDRGSLGRLVFKIKRGEEVRISYVFDDRSTESNGSDVQLCWSAQGRRAAWLLYLAPITYMRDTATTTLVIGQGLGPRVRISAEPALLSQAVDKIGDLLEQAGFYPTQATPLRKPVSASVVSYKEGFKADAAKVAAALGGLRLLQLTDPKDDEILVELAADAVRARTQPAAR